MQDIKINDKIMPNDLKRSICNHFILWCSCIAILIFSSIISTDYFNQEFLNQKIISKISNIVITKVNSINPFYSRKLGISGTINTNSKDISNILISNLLIINKNTNSNLNNIIDSSNIPVFEWFICIPKIDLKAEIVDGTTQDILNKYVGHFEETPKLNGNVALAAHNRGYDVNYFALIKDLQVNDEIYYYYDNNLYEYSVNNIAVIEETDWTMLENTNTPILTLITCVEDMPNLRRCLQADFIGIANERVDILDID